jgi:hypothetical protein
VFVWTCGLTCIGLAAWFEYYEYVEGPGHWTLAVAGGMWATLGALFAAVSAAAHAPGRREHLEDEASTGAAFRRGANSIALYDHDQEDQFTKRLLLQ